MAKEGATTFYQLEMGGFKPAKNDWLPYIGRRVRIVGSVRTEKAIQVLTVDTLTVLAPAIGEAAEAKADSARKANPAAAPATPASSVPS